MKTRRDFVQLVVTGAIGTSLVRAADRSADRSSLTLLANMKPNGRDDWVRVAEQLATPVLTALAERKLKATMPVESHPSSKDREKVTHLEAFARLLVGLAPWLELGLDATPEGRQREKWAALARAGIDAATDPASPDFMNFSVGGNPWSMRRSSPRRCDAHPTNCGRNLMRASSVT